MSSQMFGLARLGRDIEVRETQGGDTVANLSLAFNYGRKGDDGRKPTQWVEGTLWGKLAEVLEPYLLKGTTVAVTLDDVHIETYQTRDGAEGHKLVGRVTSIEMAGGGERAPAPAPAPAQRQAPTPTSRYPASAPRPAPAKSNTGFDDLDDDIPF